MAYVLHICVLQFTYAYVRTYVRMYVHTHVRTLHKYLCTVQLSSKVKSAYILLVRSLCMQVSHKINT